MSSTATIDIEELPRTDPLQSKFRDEPKSRIFQFTRPDWSLFRSIPTLAQKAGVSADRLPRLVLKELVDNALDAAGTCEIIRDGNTFRIEDQGAGLPGTAEDIAEMFSIGRPLVSSKLWRMPTRGALGNGLRVVAGSVLATRGTLVVTTRNQRHELTPQDDGTTSVKSSPAPRPVGTAIEISFGDEGVIDTTQATKWADRAIMLATGGTTYKGRTSPHWYDADSFHELLLAARDASVREIVEQLDGCSGAKAGEICGGFQKRTASSLSKTEAVELLQRARTAAKPVNPERLGRIGTDNPHLPDAYAHEAGTFSLSADPDAPGAEVPYIVEAWAATTNYADSVEINVNRTPITAAVTSWRNKEHQLVISSGDFCYRTKVGRQTLAFVVNIITPYMPITTDGKAPDLERFAGAIIEAIEAAARKATRILPKESARASKKDAIVANLKSGIAMASGNGQYRFSLRQLYYAVRPAVLAELELDALDYNTFSAVITDHEAENGDIEGMTRDPRGTLYHPHLHEEIPLGTEAVENYQRPEWTFNKCLYAEKEGLLAILKADGWPERNDCALLTSKGYASRAARDLLDLLGDGDEPIEFYCIHDADAYGTTIYQSLVEATAARPARKVHVVNLGLEPAEALEMKLEVETFTVDAKRDRAVAEYVPADWKRWLQVHRVELNAMTTPQFLDWLNAKFSHAAGKVIPPAQVMADRLRQEVRTRLRERLTDDAIKNARVDERTDEIVEDMAPALAVVVNNELTAQVTASLADSPDLLWSQPIKTLANKLAEQQMGGAQ
ncbi:MAG: hypothetical protein ABSH20_04195 [Tepidisphaeraceae bacterium]|jgi:hypothetical protein